MFLKKEKELMNVRKENIMTQIKSADMFPSPRATHQRTLDAISLRASTKPARCGRSSYHRARLYPPYLRTLMYSVYRVLTLRLKAERSFTPFDQNEASRPCSC